MKRLLFFLCFVIVAEFAVCQEELIVGTYFEKIPDTLVEDKIGRHAINYVDALDYYMLNILHKELTEKNYRIRYRQVLQVGREEALTTKDTSKRVDILLFSFSNSYYRSNELKIEFSLPYYINNHGIGVFTDDKDIGSENISKGKHRIALIENSTADTEMKGFIANVNNQIEILRCKRYEDMVDSLLKGKACMILADVSRMSYFLDINKNLVYVSRFRSQNSTGDGFCVAIRPEKKYLKKTIDVILAENDDEKNSQIKLLLDGPIQNTLSTQVSETERLMKSEWVLLGLPIGSILVFTFLFWLFSQKKPETAFEQADIKTIKDAVNKASNKFLETFGSALDTQMVWKVGIQSLNDSEKEVLYVGSGGFMSSEGETGATWREAIYGTLNKGVKFIRIVDLPDKEFLFKKKKTKAYMAKFYTWLVIQYLDLRRYANLSLFDSRGAAYWGVGSIMLFKDEKSVLVFTSTDEGKMGTLLEKALLVSSLKRDILETREIGEEVTAEKIMKEYFKGYPIMIQLVTKISESLQEGETISEATMKLIGERVKNHVDSLEELEEDNAAPL